MPIKTWLLRAYVTKRRPYLGTIAIEPRPRFISLQFRCSGSWYSRLAVTGGLLARRPGLGSGDRFRKSRGHGVARATGATQAGAR